MRRILLVALLAMLLVPAACGGSPGSGTAEPTALTSDLQRETSPQVPESALDTLAAGNTAFALDLYQALKSEDGNLFFSPYSISLALAMAYAGARGDTEAQMAATLHYLLSQDQLHLAFNALDLELARRGQAAAGKDGEPFRLRIANSTWGQEGYDFLVEYLDTLAANYGAGIRLLDFESSPEDSRATINGWVDNQTEGRIRDLIPPGSIDTYTRLVLANAVYFNAAWQYPFLEELTRDGAFTLPDGSRTIVPMMHQVESLGYFRGDNYTAVELPYDGGELSMVVLLPDQGKLESFESGLSADRLQAAIDGLSTREVQLALPQFEFDASLGLAETLAAMGLPLAFSDAADFSGINGRQDLHISDVVHKAFVSVDEAGTEAAAATAVLVGTTSMPQYETVTVDRPFLFLVRDIQTDSVLFLGRVLDPGGRSGNGSSGTSETDNLTQQYLFEVSYVNWAWGYQDVGAYIDRDGYIWSYDLSDCNPKFQHPEDGVYTRALLDDKYSSHPAFVGTVDKETLARMTALIGPASQGTMTDREQTGADRGGTSYRAFLFDPATGTYTAVLLYTRGDWTYGNAAPEAVTLRDWLMEVTGW